MTYKLQYKLFADEIFTLSVILTIPVSTDTLLNSTWLNISIFSANSFCILFISLLSALLIKFKK
jgi:hypothetical protein